MLRLNLRKGDSTWRFGPAQWGIVDGDDLTPTQAAAMLNGKRVCAIGHGYNVTEPDDAYAMLSLNLAGVYDELIWIRWPGSKWKLAFWLAMLRAPKAGRLLAEALSPLECAALDIEGHSLFCRVALEAMLNGLRCRNLILAGAAVANQALAISERFGWCVANAQRVLVAFSRHDEVLSKAGRLGLFDNPLGLTGPEIGRQTLKNVIALDCSESVDKHSAYKRDTKTFIPAWRAIA